MSIEDLAADLKCELQNQKLMLAALIQSVLCHHMLLDLNLS